MEITIALRSRASVYPGMATRMLSSSGASCRVPFKPCLKLVTIGREIGDRNETKQPGGITPLLLEFRKKTKDTPSLHPHAPQS